MTLGHRATLADIDEEQLLSTADVVEARLRWAGTARNIVGGSKDHPTDIAGALDTSHFLRYGADLSYVAVDPDGDGLGISHGMG